MERLIGIVGPTAVGKSEVALRVAEKLGGEIISADSVQVYRHMDIGTAKPSLQEQQLVKHHLLDIVEPDDHYTVADYQRDAHRVIDGVHARHLLPVLAGGSGLYVRAVIQDFAFSETAEDRNLRDRLRAEANQEGTEALYERLKIIDPTSALHIHPNDIRRIIRALEVYEKSNQPLSDQVENTVRNNPRYQTKLFGLTMPRDLLYQRIEVRVDQMIKMGLVEEVRDLLDRGYNPLSKAMQSVGYRHIVEYLQGKSDLATVVETLKRDTRRLAKRQLTWFKREPDIIWLDIAEVGGNAKTAENICYYWQEINN